jgi:glutamine amidotransferase
MQDALNAAVKQGREVLGICLGMQLMCRDSEEDGYFKGLGWLAASVKRIPKRLNVKVPHIGWNDLHIHHPHYLFEGLSGNPDVYFVHSYRVECDDARDVVATSDYGEPFTAIFSHENLIGIQFHPEKSQATGLEMLKRFAEHKTC